MLVTQPIILPVSYFIDIFFLMAWFLKVEHCWNAGLETIAENPEIFFSVRAPCLNCISGLRSFRFHCLFPPIRIVRGSDAYPYNKNQQCR